ncbi:hypothetical protein HK098_004359 [Nowakowskiella sp. JEL0407]|nr:hypothetical protein HK098_004359 [Nowakowskiella sp. JEL0407]
MSIRNIFNTIIRSKRFTSSQKVDSEFQLLFTHIIHDFIASWYTSVSTDRELLQEILSVISSATKEIERRFSQIDWVILLSCQLPHVLKRHLHDFRHCRAKLGTSYAGGKTIEELFRGSQPHFALTNPTVLAGDSGSGEVEAEGEAEYLRKVVELIMDLTLPQNELKSDVVRFLLREILTCTVLVRAVEKLCDPDFLNQLILRLLSDEILEDNQPFLEDLTAGDEFSTASSHGYPFPSDNIQGISSSNFDPSEGMGRALYSQTLTPTSNFNSSSLKFQNRLQQTFLKRRRRNNNSMNEGQFPSESGSAAAQMVGITPAGVGITNTIVTGINKLTFGGLGRVSSGMEKIKNMVKEGSTDKVVEEGKERKPPRMKRFSRRRNQDEDGRSSPTPKGRKHRSRKPGSEQKLKEVEQASSSGELNTEKSLGQVVPTTPVKTDSTKQVAELTTESVIPTIISVISPLLSSPDAKTPKQDNNSNASLPPTFPEKNQSVSQKVSELFEDEEESDSELTDELNTDFNNEFTDTQSDSNPLNFNSFDEGANRDNVQNRDPATYVLSEIESNSPSSPFRVVDYDADESFLESPTRILDTFQSEPTAFTENRPSDSNQRDSLGIKVEQRAPLWWEVAISYLFILIRYVIDLLIVLFVQLTGKEISWNWNTAALEATIVAIIMLFKKLWSVRQEIIEGPTQLGPIDTTKYKDERLEEPVFDLVNELFQVMKRSKWVFNQFVFFVVPISHGIFRDYVNRAIIKGVYFIICEDQVAYYIKNLRLSFWPHGYWDSYVPVRTAADKEYTRRELEEKLKNLVPENIKSILGAKSVEDSMSDLVQAIQRKTITKHLFYILVDLFMVHFAPELQLQQQQRNAGVTGLGPTTTIPRSSPTTKITGGSPNHSPRNIPPLSINIISSDK